MRRIVLMGTPGSGKSTQGQKLAEDLGCPWVSTGEILRNSTEPWIAEKLKTAELFDDKMMCELVENALLETEDAVIDGFPRTRAQAEEAIRLGITQVIELVVPEKEVLARLADRGREQDTLAVAKSRIADYQKMRVEVLGVLGIDSRGDTSIDANIETAMDNGNNNSDDNGDSGSDSATAGDKIRFSKVSGVGSVEEVFNRLKQEVK